MLEQAQERRDSLGVLQQILTHDVSAPLPAHTTHKLQTQSLRSKLCWGLCMARNELSPHQMLSRGKWREKRAIANSSTNPFPPNACATLKRSRRQQSVLYGQIA